MIVGGSLLGCIGWKGVLPMLAVRRIEQKHSERLRNLPGVKEVKFSSALNIGLPYGLQVTSQALIVAEETTAELERTREEGIEGIPVSLKLPAPETRTAQD